MNYSKDLRERVISFVQAGGSKVEAARRFQVNRRSVYGWLANPAKKKTGPKGSFKLDWNQVKAAVESRPDVYSTLT
jgi:transposase